MGETSQTRRRRWLVAVPILVALLAVGAVVGARVVAGDDKPDGIRQWVAVLDVGPDARTLYPVAGALGTVAGVYVFVDRWACYTGFPAGMPPTPDPWFVGLASVDRTVVDDLVSRLGRKPIVEAEVEQGCALPVDTTPVGPQT